MTRPDGELVLRKPSAIGSRPIVVDHFSRDFRLAVLGDSKQHGFDNEVRAEMYLPNWQSSATAEFVVDPMSLVVRPSTDPLALANAVRSEIHALDADVAVSRVQTIDDVVIACYVPVRRASRVDPVVVSRYE